MSPSKNSYNEIETAFADSRAQLHVLSKTVLEGLKPPAGAYAFFSNNAHALSRLEDCMMIFTRLKNGRAKLNELSHKLRQAGFHNSPPGVQYPAEVQVILRRDSDVVSHMRLDMESLYIFGGILLDQWALQVLAVGGCQTPKKSPFTELLELFENNKGGIVTPLWTSLRKEMLWLHHQMRRYRNNFIVHANRPWQRGSTHSVYGEDFSLFTPTPPGWENDDALNAEVRKLLQHAPKHIQEAPDDYWEKAHPSALLERVFDRIGELDLKEDQETVSRLFARKGGSTPSFQRLALRLLEFMRESLTVLIPIAAANLATLELGTPFSTSKEMQEKRTKR
jgi:hypothetical protein